MSDPSTAPKLTLKEKMAAKMKKSSEVESFVPPGFTPEAFTPQSFVPQQQQPMGGIDQNQFGQMNGMQNMYGQQG